MKLQVTTAVILTVYADVLLCPIEDLHEFFAKCTGRPVATHQLGDVAENMMSTLENQLPWLAEIDATDVSRDNWQAFLTAIEQERGNVQDIVVPTPGASISYVGPARCRPGYWITVLKTDKNTTSRGGVGYEKAVDFCNEHGLKMPGLN